ncbi:variant erythrocyte surface antigen-1 family protein [Babesia caballi]|uniref:Variant erythrocyte surface antigen-1 family protein n=1 Tax=Babesia caballi TaxID=5871 RepID=A0AAV4M016_BABCB|nr:variant erythrocyte surface antigen-1 family protein [Babesia caballi]
MVDGQKSSLTEWPEDLKDVIDWMVRISFLDKSRNLKNAVEKLENFTQATQGLGNFTVEGVEGLFNYVAKALKTLIGYNTGGGEALTGKGIGSNDSSSYTSSYSIQAKWDNDMNNPTSDKAKKVALIFLCYVPILYLGITYLFWQCSNTQSHVGWKSLQLRSSSGALYLFMSSMGFDMQALQDKSGDYVAKLLADEFYSFDDFKNVSKSEHSYSRFLQKLEEKHGKDKLNANATSCPLHTLYLASTAYLKSRLKEGEDVDTTFVEIKGKIQTFKVSFNSDPDLKDAIETFIQTCLTTPRKPEAPSQPSPASAIAGTLSTLGLGGGAAAAYLFDVGGAKTLVNSLLRIG